MAKSIGPLAALSLGWALALPARAAPEPSAQALAELAQNLVVEIVENGPAELWTLHVTNDGKLPLGIVADPALLWFEVAVPGKALPVTCRLPAPLWPKTTRRRAVTQLHPGERFSRRFDPRFFCFDDMRQTTLVVGSRVTPHFGWPHETREVRTRGKRSLVNLPPHAPFVAWPVPASEASNDETESPVPNDSEPPAAKSLPGALLDDEENEPGWDQPREGLKFVTGAAIVLAPAYAAWSPPASKPDGEGLHLLMRAGSDAEDERSATITIAVANGGSRPEQIFVRRELATYHVNGPYGRFECSPNEVGPPDTASFATLAPGSNEPMVVRLIEMCPRGALSHPGLYEVRASFTSHWSGQALGLDAFVGHLETPAPALIRVRSGDQPSFLRAAPISGAAIPSSLAPNAGAANAEAEPADNNADVPPEEVQPPPEHEAPTEAPAPEAPADGTTVE